MSAMQQIREKVTTKRRGEPFRTAEFLTLGGRATVDQSLSRLVKEGKIKRVARGVFVRPKINRYAGEVPPPVEKVAEAVASANGAKIGMHGAVAAQRLGFSTQVPAQPVFYTNGPSRSFRLGNLNVKLKKVQPRKMALAGRPAGNAFSALWYLGKEEVSPQTFWKLKEQLPEKEFEVLIKHRSLMPGWMTEPLRQFEKAQASA